MSEENEYPEDEYLEDDESLDNIFISIMEVEVLRFLQNQYSDYFLNSLNAKQVGSPLELVSRRGPKLNSTQG